MHDKLFNTQKIQVPRLWHTFFIRNDISRVIKYTQIFYRLTYRCQNVQRSLLIRIDKCEAQNKAPKCFWFNSIFFSVYRRPTQSWHRSPSTTTELLPPPKGHKVQVPVKGFLLRNAQRQSMFEEISFGITKVFLNQD